MPTRPANVFVLPDLGEGLQEAEIVAWHVAEGDHVVADQPLASVETDKAVVEIPSPHSGRIDRLLAPVHARLPIGAPLVAFAGGTSQDAGTVVGELAAPPPARSPQGKARGAQAGPLQRSTVQSGVRARVAPAVRALATSLGVDLATVSGSGPDAEITRADVKQAAAAQRGAEPLKGVRRAMALRMAEAGRTVVPATVTDEADVEDWPTNTPVAARLAGALAAACRAEPALNAAFDGQALARRLNTDIHIGIAVDTADGLIVPVLRNAGALSAPAIAQEVRRLTADARARRTAPAELQGATITLSNFGSLGGQFAVLVVVPPQVAILGAGRIHSRVVAADGRFTARRMLPLSLTFDHRAVSGGEAARFLAAVKAVLESIG